MRGFSLILNPLRDLRLAGILEIEGPIRMFSIGLLAIPLFPMFLSLFWSFGAYQGASSEGFLVPFTPGAGRFTFDYWILTEDSAEGSHFFLTRNLHQQGLIHSRQVKSGSQDVVGFPTNEPGNLSPGGGSLKFLFGCENTHRNDGTRRESQGESIRQDVMNPGSLGVLEALNPTDEGRLGNGRNTQNEREDPKVKADA